LRGARRYRDYKPRGEDHELKRNPLKLTARMKPRCSAHVLILLCE
jgi:hypothetical protein